MEMFEKVEKLVEKANVSYEDAKAALEEAQGDMLDAMIILEKQGKVKRPEQQQYSTKFEEQKTYVDVPTVVQRTENIDDKSFFADLGSAIKKFLNYTIDNSLRITHKGEQIVKIPLWIALILLICSAGFLLPVMFISLFFECRYSIVGKNNSEDVNRVLNQASEFAENAKNSTSNTEAE